MHMKILNGYKVLLSNFEVERKRKRRIIRWGVNMKLAVRK